MKDCVIADITPEDAVRVIQWKYESPYDFYNIKSQAEAMQEFLMNAYYSVRLGDQLIGIFCIGPSAQVPEGRAAGIYRESYVDVGIGMAPSYTGQGNGKDFFRIIVSYLKKQFPDAGVRLSVATFNTRAIRLYENTGFKSVATFPAKDADFIVMTHPTIMTT